MTKPEASAATSDVARRQPRKPTVWSRDKIAHLIVLYRQQECLWNHYTEDYKVKERRSKAIANICSTLKISKFDFGKKIHNLRNQFNSEMKKLERRIEEAGGNASELNAGPRCRWEHFESLRFLRDVIEPRPNGYQPASFPQPKKLRLKFDYNSEDEAINAATEDLTEYNFEETTADEETMTEQVSADDFQQYEEQEKQTTDKSKLFDQKYTPATTNATAIGQQVATSPAAQEVTITLPMPGGNFTTVHQLQQKKVQQASQEMLHLEDTQQLPTGSVIELPAEACSSNNIEQGQILSTHAAAPGKRAVNSSVRDQWDAFGELVANEFRLLNSDVSRKRLKRKIMQAMLEVGEEDDAVAI